MAPMMTNRSRFALTAMIQLVDLTRNGPVSIPELSARENVSKSTLEQLFAPLRRQGLVLSRRGPGGGYLLGRDPALISVADVLMAIDAVDDGDAGGNGENGEEGGPADDERWAVLNRRILACMAHLSIASLADDLPKASAQVEAQPTFQRGFLPYPVLVPVRPRGPNSVFALGRDASLQPNDDLGRGESGFEEPRPQLANGTC
jgi:Rrf2 family iron-sulfur cluster assembly transcriptional regulator